MADDRLKEEVYDRAFAAKVLDSRHMRFAMLVVRAHLQAQDDPDFLAANEDDQQLYVREQAESLADSFEAEVESFLEHDFTRYPVWEEERYV